MMEKSPIVKFTNILGVITLIANNVLKNTINLDLKPAYPLMIWMMNVSVLKNINIPMYVPLVMPDITFLLTISNALVILKVLKKEWLKIVLDINMELRKLITLYVYSVKLERLWQRIKIIRVFVLILLRLLMSVWIMNLMINKLILIALNVKKIILLLMKMVKEFLNVVSVLRENWLEM